MVSSKKHDDSYYGLVIIGFVVAVTLLVYLFSGKSKQQAQKDDDEIRVEVVRNDPTPRGATPSPVPSTPPSAAPSAVQSQASSPTNARSLSAGSSTGGAPASVSAATSQATAQALAMSFEVPTEQVRATPAPTALDNLVPADQRAEFLKRLDEISRGIHDRRDFLDDKVPLLTFSERTRTHQVNFGFAENVKKIVAHLPSKTVTSDAVVVRMLRDQQDALVFLVKPKRFNESIALTLVQDQQPASGEYQVLMYQANRQSALIAKGKFSVGGSAGL